MQDTRKPILLKEKINLVVTSPPYGDSRTTVAYGEFSSFGLQWINDLNPFGNQEIPIDKLSLGGIKTGSESVLPSKTLSSILDEIGKTNPKRAENTYDFYKDLYECCVQIKNTLAKKAYVCFVVGNRTVAKVQIPMDEIVTDFFISLGLKYKNIYVREITSKRMPSRNSPTNVKGEKMSTMKDEFIIVLENS